MLWAAWADALGFISELTSPENFRRRTGGRDLTFPMAWSRIIGGRMGVRVNLPEGCYSDDTQLRLSTSRAISNHGFDVEAFARVELPVWSSYALGGGRASKAAATAMAKQQANWAANFFDGWERAGGNGAAMRIQPHVYAAANLRSDAYLDDVIRNTIVTHGHPRAIVGAVFHAVSLGFALDHGVVPDPSVFSELLETTSRSFVAFDRQPELSAYWRPQWERKTQSSLEHAWDATVAELADILRTAMPVWEALHDADGNRDLAIIRYEELVQLLSLDDEKVRGSGTLTAAAAVLLAAAFPQHPAQSAQIAAARLNTDTDTIGTMAAAIVGAAAPKKLLSPVLDADYLIVEADRLYDISRDRRVDAFPYPDLLHWQPPKTAVDAVGLADGHVVLAGLSALRMTGTPIRSKDSVWVWAQTDFGQSVLVKSRAELRDVPLGNHPARDGASQSESASDLAVLPGLTLAREEPSRPSEATFVPELLFSEVLDVSRSTVADLIEEMREKRYSDASIGRALMSVLHHGTAEDLDQFLSHLALR
ncbi:hypothetical protein BMW26_11275 [Microbacterium sp. 1.5R]|uniref:ADP-ribosylglycohydrolase family protein n=1 Tax=Microbacterium sp. 1.5R TaxID=1916917 RepID=UPI00090AA2DA|nr:ADP-ribosylglycohydrolase family protein [Microbacterium sp. 1.5R]APH45468.1 hypothetical protein BMW26_11275 [Microbacterium sp. 1.5R]